MSRAGINITTQVEIDGRCSELLANRFSGTRIHSDIRDVQAADLLWHGPPDLICGGFPCQDVSQAGRRAGLAGERSGLWFEYLRLLEGVRPRWCVIENVAGLLSSNDGRDLGTVLWGLGQLGYGWAYRVLDAQFFGVPQRRRRIFIVGCLGDAARAAEVLLEPESGGGDLESGDPKGSITSALTANGLGGGGPDDNLAQAGHLIRPTPDENDPETWEHASHANTLDAGGNVTRTAHAIVAFNHLQDPVTSEEVALPLGAQSLGGGICGEWGARQLTPLECERLQGFPDDWTAGFPDSTRYKMLGNAVAVPVITWIGKRLVKADAA